MTAPAEMSPGEAELRDKMTALAAQLARSFSTEAAGMISEVLSGEWDPRPLPGHKPPPKPRRPRRPAT